MIKLETTLTVKQLKDLGIINKVFDYLGINPYALNEGLLSNDDKLTFDSEFKPKKEEVIPEKHQVYNSGASIIFILEVINNCVFYVNYSQNHNVYNLDFISLEDFNEYYSEGLEEDNYYKEQFLEEVNWDRLK